MSNDRHLDGNAVGGLLRRSVRSGDDLRPWML